MNYVVVVALADELEGIEGNYNTLITGVGKVNAAYQATRAAYKFKPDNIINYGSAGSLNPKNIWATTSYSILAT